MTNPALPVRAQVATFKHAVQPVPAWEVAAFQSVVTQFSSAVAIRGKQAALQGAAFEYPELLRLCTQSAPK